jgi:hypothetical protein
MRLVARTISAGKTAEIKLRNTIDIVGKKTAQETLSPNLNCVPVFGDFVSCLSFLAKL